MQYILPLILGIGWLLAIRLAVGELRCASGREFKEDVVALEKPADITARPGFIRFRAAARLTLYLLVILGLPAMLIAAWSA